MSADHKREVKVDTARLAAEFGQLAQVVQDYRRLLVDPPQGDLAGEGALRVLRDQELRLHQAGLSLGVVALTRALLREVLHRLPTDAIAL
ncbi:MAG: hypothetical protein GWO39_03955, partial [Gammaproteobacteria bacterium]|nr:hypothetical protein [Gammaproteobacteria bacterium]NIT62967.1 hypothetical protein [Gammaproteobacteria bacterium]NIV19903.1 hypothetical protein [Gammaproteobacteria bacterium]NIY31547.1 hypothetical protein [Gammaproteobacteria bacterium]